MNDKLNLSPEEIERLCSLVNKSAQHPIYVHGNGSVQSDAAFGIYMSEHTGTLIKLLLEEIERMRDKLAHCEQGSPMDTAPKDGTEILVEVSEDHGSKYFDLVEWDGFSRRWVGDIGSYPDVYAATGYREEFLSRWWPLSNKNNGGK